MGMLQVGDVEIGDMDDLEDDLAELDMSSRYVPPSNKPPTMISDAKPIDIQTAVVCRIIQIRVDLRLWCTIRIQIRIHTSLI